MRYNGPVSGRISGRRGWTQERRTADERRQAAMAATVRLLSRMRYEDLLMEEIAAEAGMSRPLLYHYFGGKEQLAAATVRWYGHRMMQEIYHAATPACGAWLPAAVGAYLDHVTERSAWYTALTRHAYLPFAEMEEVREEIRAQVIEALLRHLAPGGGSPLLRSLLWGWIGQVETMCQEWLTHGEPDREVLQPLLCELLASALRAGAVRDAATEKAHALLAGE